MYGQYNLVEGNEIWATIQYHPEWTNPPSWVDADGIRFFGGGHIIRKNYIHDINYSQPENINPHIDCFQTFSDTTYHPVAHGIVFEQNFCKEYTAGSDQNEIGKGFMISGGASNLLIKNNIILAHTLLVSYDSTGLQIVNNTLGNDITFTLYWQNGIFLYTSPDTTVQNNILVDVSPTGAPYLFVQDTASQQGLRAGHNCVYMSDGRNPGGSPWPNDLWNVDPRFVDRTAGDYHLLAGSPAVDSGASLPQVPNDHEGNPRPVGSGWDLGAFEGATQTAALLSDLSIAVEPAGVVLSWTHLGSTVDHYEVYRAETPYFAVTDAGTTQLPDVASPTGGTRVSTTVASTPGATGTSYSYVVLPVPTLGMPYPPSNRVGVFNLPLISPNFPLARTYYVDSSLGSDRNSCTLAQNPSTPKQTVEGVMSCDPGPGQAVRFRGEFRETIFPTRSGTVLYAVQDIAQVNGSVVTFNQTLTDAYPPTDYVTIYGSRKGNSGAFAVVSVSGNRVTVDTADLPAGQFISEVASDPGTLQAAILRPVHFTAWDENDPPVWAGQYQVYHAINQRVIMVSHLKSIGGNSVNPGYAVWPAFEIDGNNSGNSDFQIFDHLEVTNAECAIATEADEFQSNYDILQFNNLHDIGTLGTASDEIVYFGYAYRPDLHHDFVQIMYNKVGPHNSDADLGDGMDIKPSAHNATIFGNEIVGIQSLGCDDAPIKTAGINAFIGNNYVHAIHPQASPGCGISIVDDEPLDPTSGGEGAIVANNIVANVKGVGIRVLDATGVQILNNTVYNILPEPNCDAVCMEFVMGIEVWNWQGPIQNLVIKNNIVQTAHIGIGRYIGSHDEYPVSIDSDYNLVFEADIPFRGTITQNAHDLVMAPGLVAPQDGNFALMATSPARDAGTDLGSAFGIDNHDAADPRLPAITAPTIRAGIWDIGAYELR